MLYISGMRTLAGRGFGAFFGLLLLLCSVLAQAAPPSALEQERIDAVLPNVSSVSQPEGEYNVRTLKQGDEIVAYAFQSNDVAPIPAYSGTPFLGFRLCNILISLCLQALQLCSDIPPHIHICDIN